MPRLLKTVGPPCLLLLVTVLVLEGLLRLVPSIVQYPPLYERDDPGSLIGIEMVPGTRQPVTMPCFSTEASVNSRGWRDAERTLEPQGYRIAVLGDSFTEGWGVSDEEMVTRQLELQLGEGVEVLNFGISSIGTVQQDILLQHEVLRYQPDIVLVMFYSNDVKNSHPVLEGGPHRKTHLHYRDEAGKILSYSQPGAFFGLRKWLRMHSALFRLTKAVHGRVRHLASTVVETPAGVLSSFDQLELYGPPRSPEWQAAWSTVEQTLLTMRDRLGPSQQLWFAYAPDIIQIADDPVAFVREYGAEPSTNFDPKYPYRRLMAFAQANDIPTVDIMSAFEQYRDAHQLPYPYFYFDCDVHWSALGHRVAAEALADGLRSAIAK